MRCTDPAQVAQAVVERLRHRRGDVAGALGGSGLAVEVVVTPSLEPVRIGFGEDGWATTLGAANPLTAGFSPDVVVRGTPEEVLAMLTAPEPTPGSMHVANPEAWPRYARVHRVVAPELRAVL